MATKRKLHASEMGYLDPLDCGSSIGYIVGSGRRGQLYGEVHLTDCNRRIEWYFHSEVPITKINRAIELLNNFRDALVKARKARKGRK